MTATEIVDAFIAETHGECLPKPYREKMIAMVEAATAEQEKRIGELERELKQATESNEFFQREAYEEHQKLEAVEEERNAAINAANDLSGDVSRLGEGLTIERQRREEAEALLMRARTILVNMAEENEGAVFNRWPIHHEPLRNDAQNLLPEIGTYARKYDSPTDREEERGG